jgi:hypothetical protein
MTLRASQSKPREQNEPPTNKDKWNAQRRGIDADYIPGFDDGEQPEERKRDN